MSNEQLGQLYELMHATKDAWKSPDELNRDAEAAIDGLIGGDGERRSGTS